MLLQQKLKEIIIKLDAVDKVVLFFDLIYCLRNNKHMHKSAIAKRAVLKPSPIYTSHKFSESPEVRSIDGNSARRISEKKSRSED